MSGQTHFFKGLALMFLALTIWGTSGEANAMKAFVIKDIRVEGAQRIEAGSIFSYLPVKVGDAIDDAKASEAIKALYATGFFSDVILKAIDNDVLLVLVEERPGIASVDFVGLKEFDKTQLLKALKTTGIAEARIFDRSLLTKAEQELKKQYLARGKYSAAVVTTVTPLERNRVGIQFSIDEGKTARIKEINVIGAKDFEDSELTSEFELQTTGFWSWYSKNDRYSKQKLAADQEKLRSFYLDRGYLEFKIDSTQVAISPDRLGIFITINITEGKPYKVASVKLAGDLPVPSEDLEALIKVKPGDVFSRKQMNASTMAMSNLMGQEGFAFANVRAVPKIDQEKHEADFTIYVDQGKRVYVRRINIAGNTQTADEVIRREVRQMEAGLYDANRVKLSRERINRLGFFEDVSIEPQPVQGTADQVDVNINVAERPTGNFILGAGYSSTEKLVFTGSLKKSNVFGTGKSIGASINTGKTNRLASISYHDPYYTLDGISQGFNIYYRTYDPTKLSISSYRTASLGAGINWGVPISEHQSVGLGVSYDSTRITTFENSPQRYLDFVKEYDNKNTTIPLALNWTYDNRDSALYPTAGMTHFAGAQVATPAGSLTYYRLGYSYKHYFALSKPVTLAMSASANYANGYDGQELPFYKNYYAGGVSSVRGFAYGGIGPRELTCTDTVAQTGCSLGDTHIGGNRRAQGSAEFLYAMPGYEKTVRLGLFYDFGQVFAKGDSISFGKMRRSTGLSLSWLSPIGPLSFSWAHTLNEQDGDQKEPFQFQIGAVF